jgi:AAHS family 4-hydroxybenzoate transporter-like MFS transporter
MGLLAIPSCIAAAALLAQSRRLTGEPVLAAPVLH